MAEEPLAQNAGKPAENKVKGKTASKKAQKNSKKKSASKKSASNKATATDQNPNVLFELGIRIAKDLPVALIKAEGRGPIFYVDNVIRVLPYSPHLWPTTLEKDMPQLTNHIKRAWDN